MLKSQVTFESDCVEVSFTDADAEAASLSLRLNAVLNDAKARGYTIEVGQRIDPLAPREAVTVASVRRARGYY